MTEFSEIMTSRGLVIVSTDAWELLSTETVTYKSYSRSDRCTSLPFKMAHEILILGPVGTHGSTILSQNQTTQAVETTHQLSDD